MIDLDNGSSNTVGVILLVLLAVIAAVIVSVLAFSFIGQQESPQAGVTYDESTQRYNAQVVSASKADKITVRSPLGTRYKVNPKSGSSEGLVAFTNRKYTTIAGFEGKEQTVSTDSSQTGFTWDITVDKHGTEDYESIQAAVNAAEPGDVIAIEKAVYEENLIIDKDVTLVAEDGTVIQDNAPLEDVFHITASGVEVYNTKVNCDPKVGDGHYARHGFNIDGSNTYIEGVSVKNCGQVPSGTQAAITIDAKNTEVVGSKLSNNEVGLMVKDGVKSAVVRGNSISGSAADIKNNEYATLDARGNYFPGGTPAVQGVADVSNKLSNFGRPSMAGVPSSVSAGKPLEIAGKMAVNTNKGTLFLQNGGPKVDLFGTKIKVFIDGKSVVIQPTSSTEFKVVSHHSDINPDNVFDSKKLGQSNQAFDGSTVSDSTKVTVSSGESLSLDLNEDKVDTSSVSVTMTASSDAIVSSSSGGSDSSTSDGGSSSGPVTLVSATTSDSSGGSDGSSGDSTSTTSSNVVSVDSVSTNTKTSLESSTDTSFSVDAGSDYTIAPGSSIRFVAEVNGISDSNIASYEWSIDGSSASTSNEFEKTFSNTGEYRVVLKVTSSSGETVSDSTVITVQDGVQTVNLAPAASAGGDRKVVKGDSVTLDASDSYDPDGSIASYKWDFDGDGQTDATGKTVSFPTDTLGTYTVQLTVVDNDGASDTDMTEVLVGSPPTADFTYSPTSGIKPSETVTFDASASSDDGSVVKYEWDFDGDGTIDKTGKTVTYSFQSSGDKSVRLRVTDDNGFQSATTMSAHVEHPFDSASDSFYFETSHSRGPVMDQKKVFTIPADGEYRLEISYKNKLYAWGGGGNLYMNWGVGPVSNSWYGTRVHTMSFGIEVDTQSGYKTYTRTFNKGDEIYIFCKIDHEGSSGESYCDADITLEKVG